MPRLFSNEESLSPKLNASIGTLETLRTNKRILRRLFIVALKIIEAQLISQKNVNFATSKVKKNVNLTIDLLSLGVNAMEPQVLTYLPQTLRGVRI